MSTIAAFANEIDGLVSSTFLVVTETVTYLNADA